jgi:hypothetical protein
MSAQTFTGSRAAATMPVYQGPGGGAVCAAYGSFTLTETPEVGDVYQLCRLPKGAVPVGGYFAATDIDTGTESLDIDLGIEANGVDLADPDYFTNSGVLTGDAITDFALTQAANVRLITRTAFAALGAETVVSATVVAAANAGGTGTVSCVIYYVVP